MLQGLDFYFKNNQDIYESFILLKVMFIFIFGERKVRFQDIE